MKSDKLIGICILFVLVSTLVFAQVSVQTDREPSQKVSDKAEELLEKIDAGIERVGGLKTVERLKTEGPVQPCNSTYQGQRVTVAGVRWECNGNNWVKVTVPDVEEPTPVPKKKATNWLFVVGAVAAIFLLMQLSGRVRNFEKGVLGGGRRFWRRVRKKKEAVEKAIPHFEDIRRQIEDIRNATRALTDKLKDKRNAILENRKHSNTLMLARRLVTKGFLGTLQLSAVLQRSVQTVGLKPARTLEKVELDSNIPNLQSINGDEGSKESLIGLSKEIGDKNRDYFTAITPVINNLHDRLFNAAGVTNTDFYGIRDYYEPGGPLHGRYDTYFSEFDRLDTAFQIAIASVQHELSNDPDTYKTAVHDPLITETNDFIELLKHENTEIIEKQREEFESFKTEAEKDKPNYGVIKPHIAEIEKKSGELAQCFRQGIAFGGKTYKSEIDHYNEIKRLETEMIRRRAQIGKKIQEVGVIFKGKGTRAARTSGLLDHYYKLKVLANLDREIETHRTVAPTVGGFRLILLGVPELQDLMRRAERYALTWGEVWPLIKAGANEHVIIQYKNLWWKIEASSESKDFKLDLDMYTFGRMKTGAKTSEVDPINLQDELDNIINEVKTEIRRGFSSEQDPADETKYIVKWGGADFKDDDTRYRISDAFTRDSIEELEVDVLNTEITPGQVKLTIYRHFDNATILEVENLGDVQVVAVVGKVGILSYQDETFTTHRKILNPLREVQITIYGANEILLRQLPTAGLPKIYFDGKYKIKTTPDGGIDYNDTELINDERELKHNDRLKIGEYPFQFFIVRKADVDAHPDEYKEFPPGGIKLEVAGEVPEGPELDRIRRP